MKKLQQLQTAAAGAERLMFEAAKTWLVSWSRRVFAEMALPKNGLSVFLLQLTSFAAFIFVPERWRRPAASCRPQRYADPVAGSVPKISPSIVVEIVVISPSFVRVERRNISSGISSTRRNQA